MCLSDMSSCELLLLANDIALTLSKNLDSDETAILAAFLTTVADQLALIARTKRRSRPLFSPDLSFRL